MIVGVGTDLVDLGRFRTVLERRPELVDRLFTATEIAYARLRTDPTERFAVRFATKEAVLKAMGVGLGAADWHDIEVERDSDGRPSVMVRGRAAALAAELGIVEWRVTLSHSDVVATALVLALGAATAPLPPTAAPAAPIGSGGSGGSGGSRLDGGALVPIVTPEEMAVIDRDAPEPVEVLIGRAGAAVARTAVRMLGGTYGRRVVVLAGKGNNGNDGRDAARRLRLRGVRVRVLDVTTFDAAAPPSLPDCDLVIDSAYGTGLRGPWAAPRRPAGAKVLAVDIPSGVDGLTGETHGEVLAADVTVTFAALKPGLVQGEGRRLAGDIEVADIGLDAGFDAGFDAGRAHAAVVGAVAVASWLPTTPLDAHKWRSALWVVAGAPGMGGAASLCAGAALRTGAGYVRVSAPGGPAAELPIESVRVDLPADDWSAEVVSGLDRFAALVIGNGLGTAPATATEIRRVVAAAAGRGLPTVVDADALTALGAEVARFVGPNTVLTPHDGEYARMVGESPGPDRLAAARSLAAASGAVVLLKGPTTVVASPDGRVLVSIAGDRRLATAGTGDVLAGVIGALCARGLDPLRAAAAGAFIHGRAGALGWPLGLVAGDVVSLVPAVLDDLTRLQP